MATDKTMMYYNAAKSIKDAMQLIYNTTTADHAKFAGYKSFAESYCTIVKEMAGIYEEIKILPCYNTEKLGTAFNTTWIFQKEVFDTIYANIGILISILESKLGPKNSEIETLKDFIKANLRKAVFEMPENEKQVQNIVETILIARGYQKGIDYDRETGRVKVSSKEVIPDFILLRHNFAIEVKIIKDKTRISPSIDEINADIQSYSEKYKGIIFLVYDLGFIRDEIEYISSFEKRENISCIIIKN